MIEMNRILKCQIWLPAVAAVFFILFTSSPVSAGSILQAVGITTAMGNSGGAPSHVIDQSGLSAAYTSGVTDFDIYLASNSTHNTNLAINLWRSDFGVPTGNVDFDLGGTFTIGDRK
jgi:hypothetical protein